MKVGLGPVVCPECLVFANLEQAERQDGYGPREYYCPVCGTDVLEYLWLFTEEEQKKIHVNSKFVRFAQGKDK